MQTFPHNFTKGGKYIYVIYVYDCNDILNIETKYRSDKETIRAFTFLTEYLKSRGIQPGFHFMDNEASTALKLTMMTKKINYQLVPPINHRAKNVRSAIIVFKKNFIAGLCSVEKDLHIQLWDRLLQQAKISLNLLRQSRTLPHISAYTHIFGEFDFNLTPSAPPGTRVVMHIRPNDRASWAPHG